MTKGVIGNLEKLSNKETDILLELLRDKMSGRITQTQLEHGCHYWTYQYAMKEMVKRPLPTVPVPLIEWRKLSEKQKGSSPQDLRDKVRLIMQGFYATVQGVKFENHNKLQYLREMLNTFMKYNDLGKISETERHIRMFTETI